jgi:sugar/nucleoside kinase (ribokinase family)
MLGKRSNLDEALAELVRRVDYAIIKKAHKGAMVASRNWVLSLPAHRAERLVDSTGAGDAFAGGFLGELSHRDLDQKSFKIALAYACAMGSFAVEDFGPDRLEGLTRQEIDSRVSGLLNDLVP